MGSTIVDTVTCTTAVAGGQRSGAFYTKGRHFRFYVHAASLGRFKWKSSVDPSIGWDTPASPLVVDNTITTFNKCAVYLKNDTTVGVAYIDSSGHLHWKEGTIQLSGDVATGEISWGTESINILNDGLAGRSAPFYPSLWYDGDGHAWIAVTAIYTSYPTYYELDVWRNANTNSTWSKSFVVTIVNAFTVAVRHQVLGFAGSTGYILWAEDTTPRIKGKTISAVGGLGVLEDASDNTYYPRDNENWNAIAKTNDVHLAWKTDVAGTYLYHILYRKRSSDGSWGTFEDVLNTDSNVDRIPALCINESNDDLYLFHLKFVSPDKVSYKVRTAGGWGSENLLDEDTTFYDGNNIHVTYKVQSNIISIDYLVNASGTYRVKSNHIDVTPPSANTDFTQVM